MTFVMDADCLIKLTKARLKELVCGAFTVVLAGLVKREVVDQGHGHPDAAAVEQNISRGLLRVESRAAAKKKGEEASLSLFQEGGYDGLCSDDRRFVSRLRTLGVPYVTPAVFVLLLLKEDHISREEAFNHLDALAPFISADEYTVVKLKLDGLPSGGDL